MQPYDMEMGAATFSIHYVEIFSKDPWNAVFSNYVEGLRMEGM